MMRRKQSRSLVFLTELFLALTIFALCSSVCASLFAWSHRISSESSALTRAVITAQSGAEAFKRYEGTEDLAEVLGGRSEADGCIVYYNAAWKTTAEENAAYIMYIRVDQQSSLRYAEIVVSDARNAEIFRLKTSAIQGGGRS